MGSLALLLHVAAAGAGEAPVVEWLTEESIESFVKAHDKVLVNFYDAKDFKYRLFGAEYEKAAKAALANTLSPCAFASVDARMQEALVRRFAPEKRFPRLLWFAHGEPTKYHRTLKNAAEILSFTQDLNRPPVFLLKSEEESGQWNRALFARIRPSSPMQRVLEVVGSRHLDTVAVAVLEGDQEDNVTWVEEGKPGVPFDGAASVEALEQFIRQRLAKSEPVPIGDEANGVIKVVVGRTFEDEVLRADKDVFLCVYASWCGFSRKFMPMWEDFAKQVAAMESWETLTVAKMDGDQNSSPFPDEIGWRAYPTLLFFRAGKRAPLAFSMHRSTENLLKFAEEHRSSSFETTSAPPVEFEL